MSYSTTVELDSSFADAVEAVRTALRDQGFGVLTEIDVRATLRDKLDVRMEDFLILGACNPSLAHRALDLDRAIGLLLPCNVVVRAGDHSILVEAVDPRMLVTVTGNPRLQEIADDAARMLDAALTSLTASPPQVPGGMTVRRM